MEHTDNTKIQNLENLEENIGATQKEDQPEVVVSKRNTKGIVAVSAIAAGVGGYAYLSANDAEKWQEFTFWVEDIINPISQATGTSESAGSTDKVEDVVKSVEPEFNTNLEAKEPALQTNQDNAINENTNEPSKVGTQENNFSEIFWKSRNEGLSVFEWRGQKYHTKIKEEVVSEIKQKYNEYAEKINELESRLELAETKIDNLEESQVYNEEYNTSLEENESKSTFNSENDNVNSKGLIPNVDDNGGKINKFSEENNDVKHIIEEQKEQKVPDIFDKEDNKPISFLEKQEVYKDPLITSQSSSEIEENDLSISVIDNETDSDLNFIDSLI